MHLLGHEQSFTGNGVDYNIIEAASLSYSIDDDHQKRKAYDDTLYNISPHNRFDASL